MSGGQDAIGSPPPRTRTKVEHSTATMQLARTMYGDGDSWTPTQIRCYLVDLMGDGAPSLTTIRTWVIPGMAEYRRNWKREWDRRHRARAQFERDETSESTTPLLGRMLQLRAAGLSFAPIALVVALDEGVVMTEHQVRYYVNAGREPRIPKRKQRRED